MKNQNLPQKTDYKSSNNKIRSYTNLCEQDLIAPIHTTIKVAGDNAVADTLSMSVSKCANALNIKISKEQIDLLVEDLIEVYKWDAMHYIINALIILH